MSGQERALAAPTSQKPTLGRVVLVPENPDHNNGSAVASAVVVGVHGDTINVRVWADNSDTPEWRTSLHQVENPEEFETTETRQTTVYQGATPKVVETTEAVSKLHLWCWPPRV